MIEARNLTKSYGNFNALRNLNLHVNSGEVYCLLGANGAGKSTTLNLFLGFVKADSGNAIIDGQDVQEFPLETKSALAYIPENLSLYPYLTAYENLDFFCKLGGKEYSRDELHEFLEEASLAEEKIHVRTGQFSKGMRQKVGIAIALARKSKVVLLDEPTSGLDPKASNEFSELLEQMKQSGMAILMATHDLFRAKEVGTKLGIMKDGQLVAELNAGEVSFTDLEKIYLNHMHN